MTHETPDGFRGGQGRSAEDVREIAVALTWSVGLGLVFGVAMAVAWAVGAL